MEDEDQKLIEDEDENFQIVKNKKLEKLKKQVENNGKFKKTRSDNPKREDDFKGEKQQKPKVQKESKPKTQTIEKAKSEQPQNTTGIPIIDFLGHYGGKDLAGQIE